MAEETAATDAPAKKDVGGKPRRTDWQDPFLEAFGLMGIVTEAGRHARVSLDTIKRERDRNPEFAERYGEAERRANGVLLRFLHDRATTGQKVTRRTTATRTAPTGEVEVTVTEIETAVISTPALLALCKARMPELFDRVSRTEITGADGAPLQIEEVYREATPERALELAQIVVDLEAKARSVAAESEAAAAQ